jgi:hypothetical protein
MTDICLFLNYQLNYTAKNETSTKVRNCTKQLHCRWYIFMRSHIFVKIIYISLFLWYRKTSNTRYIAPSVRIFAYSLNQKCLFHLLNS